MPPSHKVFYKNKSHFADSFSRKTYFEIMPFLWIRIEDHVKKRNPINDKYSLQYHTLTKPLNKFSPESTHAKARNPNIELKAKKYILKIRHSISHLHTPI